MEFFSKNKMKNYTINSIKTFVSNRSQVESYFSDIYNNKIIDSVLNGRHKLFVLFNEKICNVCLTTLILDLNILADKIGQENIYLVGDSKSKKELINFLKIFNEKHNKMLLRDFPSYVHLKKIIGENPIIFILGPNYKIQFFLDTELFPELRKKYLSDLIPSFFHRSNSKI